VSFLVSQIPTMLGFWTLDFDVNFDVTNPVNDGTINIKIFSRTTQIHLQIGFQLCALCPPSPLYILYMNTYLFILYIILNKKNVKCKMVRLFNPLAILMTRYRLYTFILHFIHFIPVYPMGGRRRMLGLALDICRGNI
jgi:hypothetical protein